MGVIEKLASSLNRRDEVPNQELAKEIADKKDTEAIEELVDHLHSKNNAVNSDCIKVLYEIGAIDPTLIAHHANTFIQLLDDKNNRMQWGAMTALSSIVLSNPKPIYAALPKIIAAADNGTVITKDHAINILVRLCELKPFADKAFNQLLIQIGNSPSNQVPMYAEKALPIIQRKNSAAFLQTVTRRMKDLKKASQKKRVEKLVQKLNKL
jgi:HEAT repeat protein